MCKRRVPEHISSWLFDPGSLTRRLQLSCPSPFRVELLGQIYTRPCISERRALHLPQDQSALIRTVVLRCGDMPVVFARTVIPLLTLTGKSRRLAHLGERPLGAMLFADPEMRRDPLQVAQIGRGQAIYNSAVSSLNEKPESIWGRRSVFYHQQKPLLVSEIFLPTILNCTE